MPAVMAIGTCSCSSQARRWRRLQRPASLSCFAGGCGVVGDGQEFSRGRVTCPPHEEACMAQPSCRRCSTTSNASRAGDQAGCVAHIIPHLCGSRQASLRPRPHGRSEWRWHSGDACAAGMWQLLHQDLSSCCPRGNWLALAGLTWRRRAQFRPLRQF